MFEPTFCVGDIVQIIGSHPYDYMETMGVIVAISSYRQFQQQTKYNFVVMTGTNFNFLTSNEVTGTDIRICSSSKVRHVSKNNLTDYEKAHFEKLKSDFEYVIKIRAIKELEN